MSTVKFENDLDAPLMMVKSEPTKGKKLMIFFGGMAGKLDMPTFEFLLVSNSLSEDWAFLFFKDLECTWYHDIFDDVVLGIREYIQQYEPSEIVMVGNSMGGYAAIMFGIELGADRVVSFIPQTVIDPFNPIVERGYGERTKNIIDNRYSNVYFDLSTVSKEDFPIVDLWYTASDISHAMNLANIQNVRLHKSDAIGHSVVPHLMKTKGLLQKILEGKCDAK